MSAKTREEDVVITLDRERNRFTVTGVGVSDITRGIGGAFVFDEKTGKIVVAISGLSKQEKKMVLRLKDKAHIAILSSIMSNMPKEVGQAINKFFSDEVITEAIGRNNENCELIGFTVASLFAMAMTTENNPGISAFKKEGGLSEIMKTSKVFNVLCSALCAFRAGMEVGLAPHITENMTSEAVDAYNESYKFYTSVLKPCIHIHPMKGE